MSGLCLHAGDTVDDPIDFDDVYGDVELYGRLFGTEERAADLADDLSLSNILVRDGKVTGVVDIDATGRGCAVYDLLNVALNGLTRHAEPDALALLHEYALDTYERAAVTIAATCLVVEGLAWGSAHRSDELGIMYRTWLRSF